MPRILFLLLVILTGGTMSACNPLAITALGIGANTGMSHALGGIIYKTFTAPVRTVEVASLGALQDMDISVLELADAEAGERVISAKAKDRHIQIVLEPLTRRATRMRVIAQFGVLSDAATATEIVLQTERVLAGA